MSVQQITYPEARALMQPGDVIAFGGKGNFSEIIKFAIFSCVSHVFNQIIESTSLDGFNGVNVSRFSDRLNTYDGELWWLPLRKQIRERSFDRTKFFNFLFNQTKERKAYDMPQALKSAVDLLEEQAIGKYMPTYNREDFSKFFCSELVAAGLEVAGAVDSVNASEVTPIDLCRWSIYENSYYQIKGESSKRISRFNTAPPSDWNV